MPGFVKEIPREDAVEIINVSIKKGRLARFVRFPFHNEVRTYPAGKVLFVYHIAFCLEFTKGLRPFKKPFDQFSLLVVEIYRDNGDGLTAAYVMYIQGYCQWYLSLSVLMIY